MKSIFKPMIWIEGNIGSGKSTLTKMIETELNLLGFYEPVETNPYLKKFYENPKRWAFPMQIHLLQKRYAIQQQAAWTTISHSNWNGAVIDRGIPGDRVFAKIHYDDGNIHEMEWNTYQEIYQIMAHSLTPPSLMVYLEVDPDECYNRARQRARDQESVVPDEEFRSYLVRLDKYYLELVEEIQNGGHVWSTGIRVIKVDWNDQLSDETFKSLIERIKEATNL